MATFGAAILDVVGSTKAGNRAGLQDKLNKAVADFNLHFAAMLPVPAEITVGDEWEFITDRPGRIYELTQWLQDALLAHGIDIYAGLGLGGLDTPLEAPVRQLDGPCFHLARQALAVAKNADGTRHKHIFSKRNRVYFRAEDEDATARSKQPPADGPEIRPALPEVVNTLIENTEILKARMSKKQRQTFRDYRRLGSYRRIIEEDGGRQTPGGISQKLNAADCFVIMRNERLIERLLTTLAEEVE